MYGKFGSQGNVNKSRDITKVSMPINPGQLFKLLCGGGGIMK